MQCVRASRGTKKMCIAKCVALLLFGSLSGCSFSPDIRGPVEVKQSSRDGATLTREDQALLSDVASFAGSDTRKFEEEWARLQSRPRREAIDRLVRLSEGMAPTDHRRMLIAFALCNLDHEYASNKQTVLSGLSRKPVYERSVQDWAVSLADRLMQRGDKTLLGELFKAASWSDGMTSEELNSIYERELAADPNNFVSILKAQSAKEREAVYQLTFHDHPLTPEESARIRSYLHQHSSDAGAKQVMSEILKHLAN
jgi:hypothetical protein